MAAAQSWTTRIEKFRASKTQTFWACAACVAATLILGFGWGGWVTGSTARDMEAQAASEARADMAAAFCVHQFSNDPEANAKLAALKGSEYWKRSEFIEKGGWVTVPGLAEAVSGAATICAQQLIDAKAAPVEAAAGSSG